MEWRSIKFDWNHARAFLVTAEEGSLSAAARALGMTQPTLGRQVSALEEELGVALFERAGKGFLLTPNGLELLEHVRAMGQAAGSLSLSASGQSNSIAGNVCISATDLATTLVLPAVTRKLRNLYPAISLELVSSNMESDLKRREADIAIRGFQPTQPDLIAKKLGDITAHLYASTGYLSEFGRPKSADDLTTACFVCDKPDTIIKLLRGFDIELSRDNFPAVTESIITQWELVKSGVGMAVLPDQVAATEPSFHKVLPDLQLYRGSLWLVVHRELRTSHRVRLVYEFLARELARWFV